MTPEVAAAMAWLQRVLKYSPRPQEGLVQIAKGLGISITVLEEAAGILGVMRTGQGGKRWWSLPSPEDSKATPNGPSSQGLRT
jgi:hypothetical protein